MNRTTTVQTSSWLRRPSEPTTSSWGNKFFFFILFINAAGLPVTVLRAGDGGSAMLTWILPPPLLTLLCQWWGCFLRSMQMQQPVRPFIMRAHHSGVVTLDGFVTYIAPSNRKALPDQSAAYSWVSILPSHPSLVPAPPLSPTSYCKPPFLFDR